MNRMRPIAVGQCLGLAFIALASGALAQTGVSPTPPSPEVQAAMQKAGAGDPAPLTALADKGNAEAQYYAGVLYIFGRGTIPKNTARGCAYEQSASASRADAMHLVGLCYQNGGFGGAPDKAKAEAAFTRAAALGFPKSKCALGQMLMTDPGRAKQGLSLCKEAANAGDAEAQVAVGDAYVAGGPAAPQDLREARKWYAMAAQQNDPQAARKLGEMYARGDGGGKDPKKAMELWTTAEKAGDPLVAILVADTLFADMTGRTPGPGKYAFRGGIPVEQIDLTEEWYRQALNGDPRPEVKKRADYAIKILGDFQAAARAKR
jgi:TPR repeat protein